MSKYADIEPIIKKIKYSMEVGEQRGYIWLEMVLKDLEKQPIADVTPIIHGHWIRKEKIFESGITYARSWWYECSNCGEKPLTQDNIAIVSDYCPWCGAKMDEVTE